MKTFIRISVPKRLSEKTIWHFVDSVQSVIKETLTETESYSTVNLGRNTLELNLSKSLTDEQFQKIYENIQLENFELETNHTSTDSNKRLIVVYPGRFQMWHKGHKAVFDNLQQHYKNADVYIATSNKTEPGRSPFTFEEKKQMIVFTGVDAERIVETNQPYSAKEITQRYNANNTAILYAVGKKDMQENPRFNIPANGSALNKNGEKSYFQRWDGIENAKSFDTHGYITTIKHYQFSVLGKKVSSSTQLRNMFGKLDESHQKQFIIDLFGKYSPQIHKLLISKLS